MKKRKIETPLFTVLGVRCPTCACRCGHFASNPSSDRGAISAFNNERREIAPDKLGSFALRKAD